MMDQRCEDISQALSIGGDAAERLTSYWHGSTESGKHALEGFAGDWKRLNAILPATPQDVRNLILQQSSSGRDGRENKPQAIKRTLAIVSDLHAKVLEVVDPTKHILVTSEMKALYRERGSRARPITSLRLKGNVSDIIADEPLPGSIIQMLRALEGHQSGWALRARVVLGLGADTGRDRSDYIGINIGDLIGRPEGSGHLLFGGSRSKDEIGEAPKFVSPDTMGFIRYWLEWREKTAPGSTTGDAPLLVRIDQKGMPGGRLSVWGYVDVLKDITRRVGNGVHVSGNSFQAGLKLDLAAIGTTKVGIANALGFKEI